MIGSLLQAPWAVGYALLALLAYFCKSWKVIQVRERERERERERDEKTRKRI